MKISSKTYLCLQWLKVNVNRTHCNQSLNTSWSHPGLGTQKGTEIHFKPWVERRWHARATGRQASPSLAEFVPTECPGPAMARTQHEPASLGQRTPNPHLQGCPLDRWTQLHDRPSSRTGVKIIALTGDTPQHEVEKRTSVWCRGSPENRWVSDCEIPQVLSFCSVSLCGLGTVGGHISRMELD
jgi:hypothetical protein